MMGFLLLVLGNTLGPLLVLHLLLHLVLGEAARLLLPEHGFSVPSGPRNEVGLAVTRQEFPFPLQDRFDFLVITHDLVPHLFLERMQFFSPLSSLRHGRGVAMNDTSSSD